MQMGEENIVVPLDSLERSPATSYAAIRSSSPAFLSVVWDSCVSHRSQAGASVGRVAFGPRQRMLCGPPSLIGPAR